MNEYPINLLKGRVNELIDKIWDTEKWHDRQFAGGKAEGIIEALYHMDVIGDMEYHQLNKELSNALYR